MRVLLTGATGQLGPYVLERLVANGHTVQVLALPETVAQVKRYDWVTIVAGSLSDKKVLAEATQDVDVIYHLAGLLPSSGEPDDIFWVNVHGTESLLHAAVTSGVHRFVFVSSAAVYMPAPWPSMWPITEDFPRMAHGADSLRSYSQSKIDAENLILRYHQEYELEYVILRPEYVYGPRSAPNIGRLVRQLMWHPWMTTYRDFGLGSMQWVHVCDLADVIEVAGVRLKAANNVFNVAGGEVITVRDIARTIRELMSKWPRRNVLPFYSRARDHSTLKYDISKAQTLLGYAPRIKLREGLQELIAAIGTTYSS